MVAIVVNSASILVGSIIGLIIKNNVQKRITDAIMVAIGLFTVYIGITSLTSNISAIVYLLAIVIGGVFGTLLKIEDRIDQFSVKIQKKFSNNEEENRFAAGFAGFFIVSCVGAFTIVASFNVGLGDNTMMYTKAAMDFVVSMAMASSLGAGVLCAGVPIILYECILAGFSSALAPVLDDSMIEAFSCMGAILTIAIGSNVTGATKFKVVNYVPSLLLAPLFAFLISYIQ